MKKTLLFLSIFSTIFIQDLFCQDIDIKKDNILLNDKQVGKFLSTKVLDTIKIADNNDIIKLYLFIRADRNVSTSQWYQLTNAERTISTDLLPKKFRAFKYLKGIAEELVMLGVINENGFDETNLNKLFENPNSDMTNKVLSAELEKILLQKERDSMETIYNNSENIKNRTSKIKVSVSGNSVVNSLNNETIGYIETITEAPINEIKSYKLYDLDRNLIMSGSISSFGDGIHTRYDGYTFTTKLKSSDYTPQSISNMAVIRNCDLKRSLNEKKQMELDKIKNEFFCNINIKEKQDVELSINGNKEDASILFEDVFVVSQGSIINLSGKNFFNKYYINEKGKEKSKGYANREFDYVKVKSTGCLYTGIQVPAKEKPSQSIGIGSISLNINEYDYCKEIYVGTKISLMNCRGLLSLYDREGKIAYRDNGADFDGFVRYMMKNNTGKKDLKSKDEASIKEWISQF